MVAYPPGSDYFSSALRFVLNAYSYAFFSLLFLSFFSVSIVSGLLACVCCACHVQYNGMALHSPCCFTTSNLLCSSLSSTMAWHCILLAALQRRISCVVVLWPQSLYVSPGWRVVTDTLWCLFFTSVHPLNIPIDIQRTQWPYWEKKTKIHAGVHI